MTKAARSAPTDAAPTDPRHAVMAAVSAAVAKMHEQAMRDRPKWFWHLLAKAEKKATRIAEEAAQGPYACGDATFCEVYAKILPALLTQALERLDDPEA
jgi:hypothetical protein